MKWNDRIATKVPYTVNTNNVPPGIDFPELVKMSLNKWNEVPLCYFGFEYLGVDNNLRGFPGTYDGMNTVSWMPKDSSDVPSEVLSANYYWINSDTDEMIEFDIIIYGNDKFVDNSDPPMSSYDLGHILTHEGGHSLWLGHSTISNAIMYKYYHTGRELTSDDIAGITSLYQGDIRPAEAATSDGGSNGANKGSACFIATAAYGSYMDKDVIVLRQFRDNVLLNYSWGRAFVNYYYNTSPPIANVISESPFLRFITRCILSPVVYGIKFPTISIIGVIFMVIALAIFIKGRRPMIMMPDRIKKSRTISGKNSH
jgi:hypothetical protein